MSTSMSASPIGSVASSPEAIGMPSLCGAALVALAAEQVVREEFGPPEGVNYSEISSDLLKTEHRKRKTAFTLIELLVVISIVAILISILLPALAKARELANRAVCMANIRGVIQAMITYGQSNNGTLPCTRNTDYWDGQGYFNSPQGNSFEYTMSYGFISAGQAVQSWYNGALPPWNGEPLAGLWIMVLQGYTTPASFICPSDPLAVGPSPLRLYDPNTNTPNYEASFTNPPNGSQNNMSSSDTMGEGESYSIAFPWPWENGATGLAPGQWWTTNGANTEVPLISDMAPLDLNGNMPGNTGVYQRATATLPTANTFGPYIYNSGNHAGDGQNVGFGDDHVTWEISPYVGQNGDNIFTYSTATGLVNGTTDTSQVGLTGVSTMGAGYVTGFVPAPEILTLAPSFDTCMTPVRTVNPSTAAMGPAW